MPKTAKLPETEWSVPIKAEEVPNTGKILTIAPNAQERKALSKRLDIVALDDLKADVSLQKNTAHILHVKGHFTAKIKQACVITLETVESEISDEFEAWYSDESKAISFKRAQHEAQNKKELIDIPMLEEKDAPEPMENGQVDVGEIVTQFLSLAIPPYPTKEGYTYSVVVEEAAPPKNNLKLNPFAALKDWRPKD